MLRWHPACAAAGALLYWVHVAARMLPRHCCLSLPVPSARRSWRGWDCRLELVPLCWVDVSPAVLWGQQLPLSAPSLLPVSWILSHGSGSYHVMFQCHRVLYPDLSRGWPFWEHSHLSWALWLAAFGLQTHTRICIKTNVSIANFVLELSEGGPGSQWLLILISPVWYREKPVPIFVFTFHSLT